MPSEIVGSIKDAVKVETGLKYKKGNIFDPFIQKEAIYFTLFNIDEDKKTDKNQLYNVVAQPYRKINNNNQGYNNNQAAQPTYEQPANNQAPTNNEPPMEFDNDEIQF
jgi:single-stranded DNA-binding protein